MKNVTMDDPLTTQEIYDELFNFKESLKQLAGAFGELANNIMLSLAKTESGEPSDDLISRADAIEAIEIVNWYHQNKNKDMIRGANDDEHQAWYKADDIYKALETVPSANKSKDEDLISRTEAIEALGEEPLIWCDEDYEIAERNQWRADVEAIKSVPSANRPKGK